MKWTKEVIQEYMDNWKDYKYNGIQLVVLKNKLWNELKNTFVKKPQLKQVARSLKIVHGQKY